MNKFSNGYFANHQNPEVVDLRTALHCARQAGNTEGKVVADYLWDGELLALLVTFSNDIDDEI